MKIPTQNRLIERAEAEVAVCIKKAESFCKRRLSIMSQVFGRQPDRCHQYDTRNSVTRTVTYYAYTCQCGQDHRLSAIRHQRSLRRQARYLCAKCKTVLVPAKATPVKNKGKWP